MNDKFLKDTPYGTATKEVNGSIEKAAHELIDKTLSNYGIEQTIEFVAHIRRIMAQTTQGEIDRLTAEIEAHDGLRGNLINKLKAL